MAIILPTNHEIIRNYSGLAFSMLLKVKLKSDERNYHHFILFCFMDLLIRPFLKTMDTTNSQIVRILKISLIVLFLMLIVAYIFRQLSWSGP
jgi:hypothetical protein